MLHIALIGTYPPTRCGIATFTADVEGALTSSGLDVTVIGIDRSADGSAPFIARHDLRSYRDAARWINHNGIDAVLIEHEFGILGGEDGDHLLALTTALEVPYMVTLHTVLTTFSPNQHFVLKELCEHSAGVTVFTTTARDLIVDQRIVTRNRVFVVPHGAPEELYRDIDDETARSHFDLSNDATVASTFGLLSPGKGIELAIEAIASYAIAHPDFRYLIAGQTHPGVVREHGETYRRTLKQLAVQLGIEEQVIILDRFMSIDEIAKLLAVTDVFLTPYHNKEQSVSGALTFALAAGCPVVSTPYRYALDMLSCGAGVMTPFKDSVAFGIAVAEMLDDRGARANARRAAQQIGAAMSWPAIGRRTSNLLQQAVMHHRANLAFSRPAPVSHALHDISAAQRIGNRHLRVLCDDTAILQHAYHAVPRHEEGYCVDDAGRMLPISARLSLRVGRGHDPDHWSTVTARMLSFLRSAELSGEGQMRNFMSWDRQWLDEPHGGDHVGRAAWGLGELIATDPSCAPDISGLFERTADAAINDPALRTVVYALLGVVAAHRGGYMTNALYDGYERLDAFTWPDNKDWPWLEPRLTYDNARIAEVLVRVGAAVGDSTMTERGLAAVEWLQNLSSTSTEYLRVTGHLGLGPDENIDSSGDEQPLEVVALIDAAGAHWSVTGDPGQLAFADRAWAWFLGANRLGIPLADAASGRCCDALGLTGPNLNCGAESTLAMHRAAHSWYSLNAAARGSTIAGGDLVSVFSRGTVDRVA